MPLNTRLLTTNDDLALYDAWVQAHPAGSLWQSGAWKNYQEALGREVRIYAQKESQVTSHKSQVKSGSNITALVVIDRTAGGYSTWEMPRGPLMSDKSQVTSSKSQVISHNCTEFFGKIVSDAKSEKCIAIYVSPTLKRITYDLQTCDLQTYDLQTYDSSRHVHPETTRVIDLTKSEEEILAQMHQKGRYNIKVAEKAGVTVRRGSIQDIDAFYNLLQSTGNRDGFKISQKLHYARFLEVIQGSFILIAEHEKKPIAGLIGVVWPLTPIPSPEGRGSKSGIYYYGASSNTHRNLMAPYALQWEAMRYCKAEGCTSYDLLGVSPEPAPIGDPWIGISDFKRKFGGTIVTYPPEHMLVLRPLMKTLLDWKRKFVG